MVLRRKKGGGGGKLTIKRHESLMRDQLLFMAGGGEEDSGEDLIVFRGKGRRISRRRQSKKWNCSELTVNLLPTSNEEGGGGEGITRILQGLMRGSSKFYRGITDILRNSYISFYPDRLRSLLPPETPEVSLEPGTPAWVLSSLNH